MQMHIQHATIHLSPAALGLLSLPLHGETTEGPRVAPTANCRATPPALGELWPGQGGFYAGIAPARDGAPARHLVFSMEQAERVKFGPYSDVDGAKSHHNGKANTEALLSSGDAHPAAAWANAFSADGHTDFYLPSHAELVLAWVNAPERFNPDGYYWSSTQYGRHYAFIQAFASGDSYWYGKDYEYRVRAVRTIQLQHVTA